MKVERGGGKKGVIRTENLTTLTVEGLHYMLLDQ